MQHVSFDCVLAYPKSNIRYPKDGLVAGFPKIPQCIASAGPSRISGDLRGRPERVISSNQLRSESTLVSGSTLHVNKLALLGGSLAKLQSQTFDPFSRAPGSRLPVSSRSHWKLAPASGPTSAEQLHISSPPRSTTYAASASLLTSISLLCTSVCDQLIRLVSPAPRRHDF